jgi:hypothetical protein
MFAKLVKYFKLTPPSQFWFNVWKWIVVAILLLNAFSSFGEMGLAKLLLLELLIFLQLALFLFVICYVIGPFKELAELIAGIPSFIVRLRALRREEHLFFGTMSFILVFNLGVLALFIYLLWPYGTRLAPLLWGGDNGFIDIFISTTFLAYVPGAFLGVILGRPLLRKICAHFPAVKLGFVIDTMRSEAVVTSLDPALLAGLINCVSAVPLSLFTEPAPQAKALIRHLATPANELGPWPELKSALLANERHLLPLAQMILRAK